MRRLIPDSIAGRTILVLLLGLGLSHLIGLAIYYDDRTAVSAVMGGNQIAQRIATVTRLVADAPPADRPRLIAAASGPTLRVTWGRQSAVGAARAGTWRTRLMEQGLRFYLADVHEGEIRVAAAAPTAADRRRAAFPAMEGMAGMGMMGMRRHMPWMEGGMVPGERLDVSLRLDDGSWLNFSALEPRSAPLWSLRFVLSVIVMVLIVVAVSAWVVHRFTAPLDSFAAAARRLGHNVDAPPLGEDGPREVRRLARAFNEMQDRIRRFVADRTEMVAAISHDLRTPITRLRLRADLVEDAEQQAKMLRDLDEMETMIETVLAFAREETADEARARLDLGALLQSICDDMADAGRDAAFAGGPGPLYSGQRTALRRAFTNLIDNAVKYGARARVSVADEGGTIVVRIDDDGPGIPDDEHERVFAPFYRREASRNRETGGAGLGLALTRTIIRRHGGEIILANRPQGGLRVTVTLPP